MSGGDALSEETRDLLRDTSGGAVFYHVYAPDGVFVTGYATPPVLPTPIPVDTAQVYYDAVYQGAPVRALRFSQSTSIDGLSGLFTFTVWQKTELRDGFVTSRTGPVFIIIASMIGALAVIVWFGVAVGLAPLTDLEDAISRRSSGDLSPIKRAIPSEVTGIVGRLNGLLGEVSATMTAKDAFISDAAHQLRNPIAGVLSLAESVPQAKTTADARVRSEDLREAARDLARLTDNLLTLERAKAIDPDQDARPFDAVPLLATIAARFEGHQDRKDVSFDSDIPTKPAILLGDPVMFEQAVLNMINNAYIHGGDGLRSVSLSAQMVGDRLRVSVSDDGKGIHPDDFQKSLARFSQIGPSAGSGLGLPIAAAVATSLGGDIALNKTADRFEVRLSLPVQTA